MDGQAGGHEEQAETERTFHKAVALPGLWIFDLGTLFFSITLAQLNLVPHATDRGISAAVAAAAMGVSVLVRIAWLLSQKAEAGGEDVSTDGAQP